MPQPRKRRSKYEEQRKLREAKRAERAREGAAKNNPERAAKRRKQNGDFTPAQIGDEMNISGDAGDDFISFGTQPPAQDENQFYGLLDPEEQEYYANVNNKITSNDFESDEERSLFVEAIYRESQGKELKIASSQSCSRYLEKLIMLSTAEQLRNLFMQFLGSFTYLVRHRFGSHCCEALFLQAAKYVDSRSEKSAKTDEEPKNIEHLFIQTAEELEPNIGYLLTDRFASHTVRALFLVLSGEPLDDASTKTMLASKKKEKLDIPKPTDPSGTAGTRSVPKSFKKALRQLVAAAISSLDTTYLRALATHPTGNPVLQLLLRLELSSSDKAKYLDEGSLFRKLMPDDSLKADTDSAKFISGLLYDPTGSHLIEVIVRYAPGKTFKKLYKNVWKERLANMAKNDVAGYVTIRILERLGKDDLTEVRDLLIPEVPTLVSRRRTSVIKALVERCVVREVELGPVADALLSAYGNDKSTVLLKMLDIRVEAKPKAADQEPSEKSDVHGSLLAQSMLQAPTVNILMQESLLALSIPNFILIANDPIASRVLQTALDPSSSPLSFRKSLIPLLIPHLLPLATNTAGSHVVDALWAATTGLHFLKERMAQALAIHETELRTSLYGRNVWRNWAMDTYQRRRGEWMAKARGYADDGGEQRKGNTVEEKKSAIQLARERHAKEKVKSERQAGVGGARRVVDT